MKLIISVMAVAAISLAPMGSQASFVIDLDDKRLKQQRDKKARELEELKQRQVEFEHRTQMALQEMAAKNEIKKAETSQENLLLSKSTRHVYQTGSPRPNEHFVSGSATDLKFSEAMQLLVPEGWDLYGKPGLVGPDTTVNWGAGDTWLVALEKAGMDNGLQFSVNWKDKSIFLSKAANKGALYSQDMVLLAELEGFKGEPVLTKSAASAQESKNKGVKAACEKTITLDQGFLKANVERILESCGYKLGDWNFGNADYIFDYPIETTVTIKSTGMAFLLQYIREQYGVKSRIVGRTVNFFGASEA